MDGCLTLEAAAATEGGEEREKDEEVRNAVRDSSTINRIFDASWHQSTGGSEANRGGNVYVDTLLLENR